jgi:hypothetical protein
MSSPRIARRILLLAGIGVGLISTAWFTSAARSAAADSDRVFELRTYTTHDGRLDALHRRFREHTNAIFTKHGMTMIGYWTPTDGAEKENTLVYLLAFPSREAAKSAWDAFRADPEWQAAKEASEKDGPIVKKVVSQFLAPTDYSPIK